ncbi:MAG: hypothetical protein JWO83_4475 [Caulobacteraceae bacterium]|nr:hypothetical protein [Caulobacteraceae bacterium]
MRLAAMLLAVLVVAFFSMGETRADTPRRVALVVANGDYMHAGSLKNPVNDSQIVATALKTAGFQIVEANPNLGIGAFRGALRRFRANAVGAQVALVYYAGHGIEARGKNWLIPTDAVLQDDADLDYEAIDLDLVLSATEGAELRVVVLDACRNNPFGHSWKRTQRAVGEGLAPIDVDDVLVIYSAGPGQTASDGRGANSPFAEALAKRLPQPGLPIQLLGGMVRDDVLRATGSHQRPFISASITGTPFMLVPGAAGPVSRAVEAVQADPKSTEMMFWQSASAGDDIGQLQAYLSKYPNGSFVDLAKAKIASLQRSATAAGAQRNLPAPAKMDPRALELAFWNSVSNSNDIAQLTAYVDEYPSGQFVRAARAKIAALTRPGAPTTVASSAVASSSALATPSGRTVGSAPTGNNLSGSSLSATQPLANTLPRSHSRYGDSDDYVCNHDEPGDTKTVQACQRLRGGAPADPS